MSSWSLLLALSGFQYSAPENRISFSPVVNSKDFSCFWSTGRGWGTYKQRQIPKQSQAELRVLYGGVDLQSVSLPWSGKQVEQVTVRVGPEGGGARSVQATCQEAAPGMLRVELAETVRLDSGTALAISLKGA
jgi:hypothetical protein